MVNNLPANAGDTKDVGSIPGQEDPLKKEMATHTSILAWKIPWTKEPGGLVHGILHARVLVWVAISFFRGSSHPRN